jgi:hypothetical protein
MPNWCSNGLTLKHEDPAMIKRAVEAFNKGELLNEFVPVPQSLKDTMAGSYGDDAQQAELERKTAENIERYGYGNWYDYCVNEWGTKWDVGGEHGADYEEGSESAHFSFDSAWAPPIAWYEKVEELGFEVEGFYYEPGMGFVGVYRDGYDECYELSGENSRTIRAVIGDELDDYFCISENMAEWEAENEDPDELQEFLEEGAELKGLDKPDPIKF